MFRLEQWLIFLRRRHVTVDFCWNRSVSPPAAAREPPRRSAEISSPGDRRRPGLKLRPSVCIQPGVGSTDAAGRCLHLPGERRRRAISVYRSAAARHICLRIDSGASYLPQIARRVVFAAARWSTPHLTRSGTVAGMRQMLCIPSAVLMGRVCHQAVRHPAALSDNRTTVLLICFDSHDAT